MLSIPQIPSVQSPVTLWWAQTYLGRAGTPQARTGRSLPHGPPLAENAQPKGTCKLLMPRGSSPCLWLPPWLWRSPKGVGEVKAGVLPRGRSRGHVAQAGEPQAFAERVFPQSVSQSLKQQEKSLLCPSLCFGFALSF